MENTIEALVKNRWDIDKAHILDVLKELENACCAIKTTAFDGKELTLICGKEINHEHNHEDVLGGVWWKDNVVVLSPNK